MDEAAGCEFTVSDCIVKPAPEGTPRTRVEPCMMIPCTACGNESHFLFRTRDLNRRLSEKMFSYFRCDSCGFIFLSPIPADLSAYYPADYHWFPASLHKLERAAERERYKLEIVERFCRSGRLLEIGPSWGAFLHLARRAGFEAEAIEMDPNCCRFLRDTIGVPVLESSDPVAALRALAPHDVVALWHVIEHLSDPWALLQAIAEKLKPGGITVIASPNPSALQFRVTGRLWPHVDAPRHLALIPISLLTEKAERLGLTRVWVSTSDRGGRIWNVFGWEHFFGNLTKMRVPNLGLRVLGRVFGMLMSRVERSEGSGSAYTVAFRKDAQS